MEWDKKTLSAVFDHTLLKPDASQNDIKKICNEAVRYGFAAVCINPVHVSFAAELLKASPVRTCTVIGFPSGAGASESKAEEAGISIRNGADELDMVINIGALKENNYKLVEKDILSVLEKSGGALVKVIIETCYLDEKDIIAVCKIAKAAGAHFIKTSTGFGSEGATVDNIRLIRKIIGNDMKIKAAGGIRTLEKTLDMLKAGADRIGTSAGVRIISEIK